jgi:anthranilate phosphoribosyltransferase
MKAFLERIIAGHDLTRAEAHELFGRIMSGQVPEAVLGAILAALAAKGETVDEIVGAAEAMREACTPIQCPPGAVDTCGTGGDGISTFNVSTTAAIIAAAAGAVVAKHGNRTNTRVSGSAEVLAALGVNIEAAPAVVERCLQRARVGFLYARLLHPAMKHAASVRQAMGVPTIFNVLGPLTNPAGVRRQVLGVNRPELTETLAVALRELAAVRAWVVHGLDGLCDLTITAETQVTELRDGTIRTFRVRAEDCGLAAGTLSDLAVDSDQASASAIRGILSGEPGRRRDQAVLNAAAVLVVAGVAGDLRDGAVRAMQAVDSGNAARTLDTLVEESNRTG